MLRLCSHHASSSHSTLFSSLEQHSARLHASRFICCMFDSRDSVDRLPNVLFAAEHCSCFVESKLGVQACELRIQNCAVPVVIAVSAVLVGLQCGHMHPFLCTLLTGDMPTCIHAAHSVLLCYHSSTSAEGPACMQATAAWQNLMHACRVCAQATMS